MRLTNIWFAKVGDKSGSRTALLTLKLACIFANCSMSKTEKSWNEPYMTDTASVDGMVGYVPTGDSILWNAMIHPLLNMTIKGAIWYQGKLTP